MMHALTSPLSLLLSIALCSCASVGDDSDDEEPGLPDSGLGGGADANGVDPSDAQVPTGDLGESCASPMVLTLSGGTTKVIDGTGAGREHDHDGPPVCNVPADDVDAVYQVAMKTGETLGAAISGDKGNAIVSVQKECPDSSLVGGCSIGSLSVGFEAERTFDADGVASVFVWTDATAEYTLELTIYSE
jgi:hypothetical protein